MSCLFLLDDYGQTLIANHRQAEALLKSCFFPESDAPKFLVEPSDVSGESGQNAVLTCKVDGNPAPAYTWFRNGDLQTVSECFFKKFGTPGIIYNYQPLFLHSRQILHNVNCRLQSVFALVFCTGNPWSNIPLPASFCTFAFLIGKFCSM